MPVEVDVGDSDRSRRGYSRWPALASLAGFCGILSVLLFGDVGHAPPGTQDAMRASTVAPELLALRAKWGTAKYSQHDEELIIRDFFDDRRGGVFLDVGSSHPRVNSTTYYLEEHLGWRGIAIDALSKFRSDYERLRPRTEFFSFFVSDRSDAEIDFFVVRRNDRLSSGEKTVAARHSRGHDTIRTRTITLDDLLTRIGIGEIDFLSMDIELHEPEALAGFDIRRYQVDLVCIEGHKEVRKQIREYFDANGYVELEHYSRVDPLNLYFARADGHGEPELNR